VVTEHCAALYCRAPVAGTITYPDGQMRLSCLEHMEQIGAVIAVFGGHVRLVLPPPGADWPDEELGGRLRAEEGL